MHVVFDESDPLIVKNIDDDDDDDEIYLTFKFK